MEIKLRPMKRMACSVENIGLYDIFMYEVVYYESCMAQFCIHCKICFSNCSVCVQSHKGTEMSSVEVF